MAKILAFDFGMAHIGVAVGDTVLKTATPLSALKAKDGVPDRRALDRLMGESRPASLAVGLPLNMDGSEQELTRGARGFAGRLRRDYRLRVDFVDERLSTAEAKGALFERGGFRALSRDKGRVDCAAAAVILEQYFSES